MFARIPTLLLEGRTPAEIAAMYGVKPGTLTVFCSQRGISLRKGGRQTPRIKLPDEEPLPLSNDTLKSLRETALSPPTDATATGGPLHSGDTF